MSRFSSKKNAWPKLKQAGECDSVELNRRRLLRLAKQIDSKSGSPTTPYHHNTLKNLLKELTQDKNDSPFGEGVSISAGRTQLLIAPTGGGKSILSHVAAMDLASREVAVAIVLPDISLVIEEADRLERDIETLGLNLRVATVSSASSLIRKAKEYMDTDAKAIPPARSPLNGLADFCQLMAYSDPPSNHEPGHEPCFKLQYLQARIGRKKKKWGTVSCPFASECPKFNHFRTAAAADILVINHDAFLSGKVPVPLVVDGQEVYKMSVLEMVLRHCGVVLVDEIDVLQAKAIETSGGELELESDRRVSEVHRLLDDFVRQGRWKITKRVPQEHVRRHLADLGWMAEELHGLLVNRYVSWDCRDKMRLPISRDQFLAGRLFEGSIHRLAQVFSGEQITDDEDADKLRVAVGRFSQRDNQRGGISELQRELMVILHDWPRPLHKHRSQVPKAKARYPRCSGLRVVLGNLERLLGGVRYELPTLEQYGLERATKVVVRCSDTCRGDLRPAVHCNTDLPASPFESTAMAAVRSHRAVGRRSPMGLSTALET